MAWRAIYARRHVEGGAHRRYVPAVMRSFVLTLCCVASAATAQPPATGQVRPFVLFDSIYQRPRRLWVYTPPGYDSTAATQYAWILAFDGAEYRDTMPLPRVLDSLLAAKRAPAFIAVLLDD